MKTSQKNLIFTMTYLFYFSLLPFLCALPTKSDSFSFVEDDHAAPLRVPSNSPISEMTNLERKMLARLERIIANKQEERLLAGSSLRKSKKPKNPENVAKESHPLLKKPLFRPPAELISLNHELPPKNTIAKDEHLAEVANPLFRTRQGKIPNPLAGLVPLNHLVLSETTIAKEEHAASPLLGTRQQKVANPLAALVEEALPTSVLSPTNLAGSILPLHGPRQAISNGKDIENDVKQADTQRLELIGHKRPHRTKDLENVIDPIPLNLKNPHSNDILPEDWTRVLQTLEKDDTNIEISSGISKKQKSSVNQAKDANSIVRLTQDNGNGQRNSEMREHLIKSTNPSLEREQRFNGVILNTISDKDWARYIDSFLENEAKHSNSIPIQSKEIDRIFNDNGDLAEHLKIYMPLQGGNLPDKTIPTDRVFQNTGVHGPSRAIAEKIMEAVPKLL